ncbi:hypothetical protein EPA93_06070 [Ktedonosporobacter rubrisoli]|uniref:Uncharacterized protein n=2 Tax=Ktedonosporobacter rubrisoli TaxID=2509675 RepID=A0A4P6JKU2_KTERU|nr:hypothetical protein EPA93_06070 [Ktedonosporobacter rubrisoli]
MVIFNPGYEGITMQGWTEPSLALSDRLVGPQMPLEHKLICLQAAVSRVSDELILLGQVRKHSHLK